MHQWQGKIAVVTGASAGIGLAICKRFVQEGLVVVGLARRQDKMENEMKSVEGKGKFYAVQCDVSNAQSVANAFQWIKKNLGVPQILINNAGIATTGKIHEVSRSEWEKIFNVNVMGLLECSRQAIQMLKQADVEGYIVNVNSIAGHQAIDFGGLFWNVYCGTKHAVTGLTKSLQVELRDTKIRMTSISPGYVRSDINKDNNLCVDMSKMPILEAEDIADAVTYIVGTPQRVQIQEMLIKPTGELL